LRQGKDVVRDTLANYLEKFQNQMDVIQHVGGEISKHSGIQLELVRAEGFDTIDDAPDDVHDCTEIEAREQFIAVMFMLGADRGRYGKLIVDLENQYLQGQDNYPRNLNAAYNLLLNYKQWERRIPQAGAPNDGVTFTNIGDVGDDGHSEGNVNAITDKKSKDKSKIVCHKCKQKGHYANECTNEHHTGTTMLMSGIDNGEFDTKEDHFLFFQHDQQSVLCKTGHGSNVSNTWILLDNQSTIDVFCNANLLRDIHQSNGTMDIHCNAGVTTTNMVGNLPG
jgi:Zinc knuckle